MSWFTAACLKIAGQQFFYICASFRMRGLYRDKYYNELVVIGDIAVYMADVTLSIAAELTPRSKRPRGAQG